MVGGGWSLALSFVLNVALNLKFFQDLIDKIVILIIKNVDFLALQLRFKL